MKRILIFIFCVALGAGYGKTVKPADVPTSVQTTFRNSFPEAQEVKWKLKNGVYTVKCNDHGVSKQLVVNPEGAIIARKERVALTDLPFATRASLQAKYSGYVLKKAKRVERNATLQYEVTLSKKKKKVKVMVDGEGRIIGESKGSKAEIR